MPNDQNIRLYAAMRQLAGDEKRLSKSSFTSWMGVVENSRTMASEFWIVPKQGFLITPELQNLLITPAELHA